MNRKKLGSLALATALFISLFAVQGFAHAGEVKLETAQQLSAGTIYQNTVSMDGSTRIESFSLLLDENVQVFPITVQSSGAIYSRANILSAVEQAEKRGYTVLGAINSDYFSSSTGVPMGIMIENGIYQSSAGNFAALAFSKRGEGQVIPNPTVSMTVTNESTQADPITVHHFNKPRTETGGIYLLNSDFSGISTRTKTDGWMVRLETVEGEMTVSGTVQLRVTEKIRTSGAVKIGAGNYILTAADQGGYGEVFDAFSEGDVVTVETACENEDLIAAKWATGGGDVLIADGEITDTTTWQHIQEGRAPRTAVGMKEDGTLVFYVVDGRKAGYSSGLSEKNLADELLRQGCVWAINMDGGGSTSMALLLPGSKQVSVINRPSDGANRDCATYIVFAVKEDDDIPVTLAPYENGQVALVNTSLSMGKIAGLTAGGRTVLFDIPNVGFASARGMGSVEGDIYLAGERAGTDTVSMFDGKNDLSGTATVHIVDSLTDLQIFRDEGKTPVVTMKLKPEETAQLSALGTYYGRTALRSIQDVEILLPEGSDATLDEQGLFTMGTTDCEIILRAGGLEKTIKATLQGFSDMPEQHWAYDAVTFCQEQNITNGIGGGKFGTGLRVTRGDFALFLYKLAQSPQVIDGPSFTDVSDTDYYATAISWVAGQAIANGTGEGTFSPKANITREQAFTMIRNAMAVLDAPLSDGDASALDQFSDKGDISAYAIGHIATLVDHGMVSGSGGNVNPKGNMTREEMAIMLYNMAKMIDSKG